MRLEYEEALHLSNIWHARWVWARGQADRPYTMTPAKLRLAQAAMAKRDTKVGDLCKELGVTRQTLYRFVDPKGGAARHRHEAAQAQGPPRQLMKEQETKKCTLIGSPTWSQSDPKQTCRDVYSSVTIG